MDQDAKTRWQRAKPPGQIIGLPGYLVGGEWLGVGHALPRLVVELMARRWTTSNTQ